MMKTPPKTLLNSLIASALLPLSIAAEPWIDTSDIYLKANIQLLADSGHILTPVTTYPLMWHDIDRDMKDIAVYKLTQAQQNAYFYIKHQFRLASSNQTRLKAQLAAKNTRFSSFGDTYRDKNSLQIQSSRMFHHVATNVSYSFYPNTTNQRDKKRLDNSYIAGFLGNWVLAIGKQDRWFGPTWDTSLSLSNNARPMTAVSLSRKSAEAFIIPFTDFDIPWTVTSFMGKMDDKRRIEDTLLWGFRLNLKPFKNVELGITRLAQWGGKGRPQNLKTFWNLLKGKDNCGAAGLDCRDNNEPGNQQAGFDIRFSFNVLNTPMAFYSQYFAEDGANEGGLSLVTKAEVQGGIDMHIDLFSKPSTLFLEFTDSFQDCNDSPGSGDCFYEHHLYKTGMRYQGRTLGNLYDNDAKSFVLGAITQLTSNTRVNSKVRYLDLNYDNSDKNKNDPLIGNPLTSIAEQMFMLSSTIQHSYQNWRFSLGAEVGRSSFDDNIDDKTHLNASFTLEYNL